MNVNKLKPSELHEFLWKVISGPGVAKRHADNAALPVMNVKNDGVRFDPAWQDDIVDGVPPPKTALGKMETKTGTNKRTLGLGGRNCPFCGAGPPHDPLSRSPSPDVDDDSWWCPNCRRFYPTRAYKCAHPDCWEFIGLWDDFCERHRGKIRKRKTKPPRASGSKSSADD